MKHNLLSAFTYSVIKDTKRRIYDLQLGGHTNLNELRQVVQNGVALDVIEQNTGRDVTRETLLLIWIECERREHQFSANQLRELIRIQNAKDEAKKKFVQFSVSTLVDIGAID